MDSVTTRELKNQTSRILRRVRAGERVTVTSRGEPVAIVIPIADARRLDDQDAIRPFGAAWADIEAALAETEPPFASWREAIDQSRRR